MTGKNEVRIYDAPRGAVLQRDYRLRVRAAGEEEWQQVPIYQVKVDMHDVRKASMAYFDFLGEAEVEISGPYYIYQVDIRPLSRGITADCDTKVIRFRLSKPENLSVEINKDRYHNLHLFAGRIAGEEPDRAPEHTLVIEGSLERPRTFSPDAVTEKLNRMPKGRTLIFTPGIHYVNECTFRVPSDTNVYFEGGAVLIGTLICERVKNIRIYGKGVFYLAGFERLGGLNAIRVSHSENICIEDLMFINPPHYTVMLGGSRQITISDIKSFSCEGWSDGIDMMSCENVRISGGFLRNSDDCIAIYGSRWDYFGDTRDVVVQNLTVWADVAHPLMMGTHGNHQENGDTLENIRFENIDILEHNEYQAGYLGCMAINVGDKNMANQITYENIRIEPFLHGKVLDVQVRFNPDYNPAPGRGIRNVVFRNISYLGDGEIPSVIAGYNEEFTVEQVRFENYIRNGKPVTGPEEANLQIGSFAGEISFTL